MSNPILDTSIAVRPGARVVVAMSGGVDSSATAALLVEQGFDVVGVTLQLYDHGAAATRPGSCCAGRDIRDARRVAERLDIPHYVLDLEDVFRRDVIDDFAATYARGETPIPCVRCNETVKFRDLLERSRALGAEALVTGHYARRVEGPDGPHLLRGRDHGRDQSYFLFATTRAQLAMVHFPLGGADKEATRALARRFDLPVAEKADSQDICFVPQGSYADVVAALRPDAAIPGDIVDTEGRVLGGHRGLARYTVGQRRGLGLDGGPWYVVRLDGAANRVVVGRTADLEHRVVRLHGVNWLGAGEGPPEEGMRLAVKLRSAQSPVAAVVQGTGSGRAEARLDVAHRGVAPGQACVFYDGERLLGGGWIGAS